MKSPGAIRAFIAVELPDAVRAALTEPVRELQACCRAAGLSAQWSRPEGWHLTLKFLGAVEPEPLALISQQLKEIASRHPPWTIWLMGFGAFPSVRRPGVLWVGVAEDAGRAALITLAKEIDAAMAPIGFPPEPRPFHPHLTLARVRAPRHLPPVAEWLEHHRADRLAVVDIQQVALMKSERGTGGSVYTAISYCDLSAKRL